MPIWVNEHPVYTKIDVPEFDGNPLIECLSPPPLDRDEAIMALSEFPAFNLEERNLPTSVRKFLPARLTRFLFPTTAHVRILDQLYIQIFDAYSCRNPMTAGGQFLLHNAGNLHNIMPVIEPLSGRLSTISMVCGFSGMGKSTLIRGCMRVLGKPVIRHSIYKGKPFPETQILYLMRNVPDQCTPKAFCKAYGDYTDALLGEVFYGKLFADKSMTRTHYLAELRRIIATHHVGALILDCAENLLLAGTKGVSEFIAMLVNMRDELKVPIILVGTYKSADILKGSLSGTRRVVEGGFHELHRPESSQDEDFTALCETLWEYQWVKKPIDFSDQIKNVLFDCSQGITGIMITLFVTTQIEAIDSGYERVDAKILKKVYQERFKTLHTIINAIRSNNRKVMENYDDLYISAFDELKRDGIINRVDTIQKTLVEAREQQLGINPSLNSTNEKPHRNSIQSNKHSTEELLEKVTNGSAVIPSEIA